MPNGNELTTAIQALTDAIEAGTAIPSEFKALVDQHLPAVRAQPIWAERALDHAQRLPRRIE